MDYKELIEFTKQERRGILMFLFSVTAICLIAEFWPSPDFVDLGIDKSQYYLPSDSVVNMTSIKEDVNEDFENFYQENEKGKAEKRQKFSFDPNLLSSDSLRLLGFSDFSVRNLINFRSKGGKIKDASKFKSIFGIDTTLVNELNGLIAYSGGTYPKKAYTDTNYKRTEYKPKAISNVEINTADSLQLDQLPGVGPYTVTKILQYRNRLGGYVSTEQLVELKIIKDSLYQIIIPYLKVDKSKVERIDINSTDFKTFLKHPYFTPDIANKIIKYRKQHGNFAEPTHISRIKALSEADGIKLMPYLKAY